MGLTSAGVLDLVRVEELHEHPEGLGLRLPYGDLQVLGPRGLDHRDLPGARGPLLRLLTALLLGLLHTEQHNASPNTLPTVRSLEGAEGQPFSIYMFMETQHTSSCVINSIYVLLNTVIISTTILDRGVYCMWL